MAAIRLKKLPDRTPVKLSLTLPPDLHENLLQYAALYEEHYGRSEALPDLVPAMLAAFLEADRCFAKRQRSKS